MFEADDTTFAEAPLTETTPDDAKLARAIEAQMRELLEAKAIAEKLRGGVDPRPQPSGSVLFVGNRPTKKLRLHLAVAPPPSVNPILIQEDGSLTDAGERLLKIKRRLKAKKNALAPEQTAELAAIEVEIERIRNRFREAQLIWNLEHRPAPKAETAEAGGAL
jgi:hypothetical protein